MTHCPSPSALRLTVCAALVMVAAAITAALFVGCADDPVRSTCVVESREITLPHRANPVETQLMLLPDARLDVVGDAFALLGTDGTYVRWVVLDRDGAVIGDEHEISVPPHRAGPWFAIAGINTPGDHLVIAYVPADAPPTGQANLLTFAVRIDNTDATAPVSSGPIAVGGKVSMMSGRGGMHAGIAWARPGQSTVWARVLGGDGLPVGSDLDLGTVADSGCLAFARGRGDLTVGYVDLSGTPPDPVFVATEITESGAPLVPFRLRIPKFLPGCVALSPAGEGYAVAWYGRGRGTFFGTYDPARLGFPSALAISDIRVEGPLPGLAGVGWLGKTYALVLAWPRGAEVATIDAGAQFQGALPLLPSSGGNIGTVSVQPVGSTLYITYPDYRTSNDRTSGRRLLAKVSCP